MQLSNFSSSKMEISEPDFFYIWTIRNDQISYIEHVLALFMCLSPYLCVWGPGGGGGGGARGLGHNLLMQFSSLEWSSLTPLRGALPKAIPFLFT